MPGWSLHHGAIMDAVANALGGDVPRDAFSGGDFARAVPPVVGAGTDHAEEAAEHRLPS